MAAIIGFVNRVWNLNYPPEPTKKDGAIRIGLLGASGIAPSAVIQPAKSHPEVIIAAVAARDVKKAEAYAKKHGIPIVHKSYQDLIDDPAIDAIYIGLPNGLHYEWALKSLKAGKHVLLEKPSVSNAAEANSLFRHELLKQPNAPVLLEAFHPLFTPAWHLYLSLLDPPNIAWAHAVLPVPSILLGYDDIRYAYNLAGGALMDCGTYCALFLRKMFGTEPVECIEATPTLPPEPWDQKCDQVMLAKWRFPNGGIGSIDANLSNPVLKSKLPWCQAIHKEKVVQDESLSEGKEHVVIRTIVGNMVIQPVVWHRVDIKEQHTIRTIADKKVLKTWTTTDYKKAYTWEEFDGKKLGEDWWISYRWMLEEFVNKIKGRQGSGAWMSHEDSIHQMEMIDSGYVKASMAIRPSHTFQ
ncbi:putative oxidoreductase [Hyaloscypha variabilis F]|uniref:D-xylose 1-dehydrogenase (NADP(+), D-xylono-1,5-lactone-forming) n=1 Tax=Hyaloscypha variabilis (strain UAMH 11265 / GT02V1 / F) TaxID=1149755 RepID=A0A2J6RAH5_HYAVF|nr:putative oxidoreductase [Hyaloscypha variabilis F]